MLKDEYESGLAGFIADLNKAFHAAGPPSYRRLEQLSARLRARPGATMVDVLTRSTTHEILHGRRQQPPKWDWVWSFVTVLRAIAGTRGIPAERIGTDAEWRSRYDSLLAAGPAAHVAKTAGGSARARWEASAFSWWPQAGAARPDTYVSLESAAGVVRTYEPRIIPALLQAESYARQIVSRSCPDAGDQEIGRLVELRMKRQARLDDPRFQLWAIVGESALRNTHIGVQVMRSQITHLINACERPNVIVQVVLASRNNGRDDDASIHEPVTHFRFPAEYRGDVVFLKRPGGSVIVSSQQEVARYSQILSRLGTRAISAEDAQLLLRKIFADL